MSCGEEAFEIDYGAPPSEFLKVLDDLDIDASSCFNPSNPPLLPPSIVTAFTSLARRIPTLRSIRWNVDIDSTSYEDEEDGPEGGSFVWRVDRGEDGEPRLVDDGSTYRRLYCCFSSTAIDLVIHGLVPDPLFDSPADFKPKCTLDDFLVGQV